MCRIREILILWLLLFSLFNCYSNGVVEKNVEPVDYIVVVDGQSYEVSCQYFYLNVREDWGNYTYTIECFNYTRKGKINLLKAKSKECIVIYKKEEKDG